MSFTILTDTSCNLPQELVDAYGLSMIPLRYFLDGEEHTSYTDGKQADFQAFYTAMRDGKVVTTTLASQADAAAVAEECAAQGQDLLYLGFSSGISGTYDACSTAIAEVAARHPERKMYSVDTRACAAQGQDLLYLGFSSGISGTYDACSTAIAEVAARHPERKMYSVDTRAASAGQGLLITYVARLRDGGKSIEECRDWAESHRLNIVHWFTVDDLMFLKRGGRISAVSAVFGTALAIKPVMHVDDDGTLKVVSKARGRKKAIAALADHFGDSLETMDPAEQTVYISHGDCLEDAEELASILKERYGIADPLITYVDPVIGAHSGPGTLALFFYDKVENR